MIDKSALDRTEVDIAGLADGISKCLEGLKKGHEVTTELFEIMRGLIACETTMKIIRFAEHRGEKHAAEVVWQYIDALVNEEELEPRQVDHRLSEASLRQPKQKSLSLGA